MEYGWRSNRLSFIFPNFLDISGYNVPVAKNRQNMTEKSSRGIKRLHPFLRYCLIALVCILLLEVSLFHLYYWSSLIQKRQASDSPQSTYSFLSANPTSTSHGSKSPSEHEDSSTGKNTKSEDTQSTSKHPAGTYLAKGAYLAGGARYSRSAQAITVDSSDQAYVDIPVRGQVSRIYWNSQGVSLNFTNADSGDLGSISIRIDALHGSHHAMGKVITFSPQVSATAYMSTSQQVRDLTRTYPNGTTLRIWFHSPAGSRLAVKSLTINPDLPFNLNLIRMGILFILALFLIALRPRSSLYQMRLDPSSGKQRAAYALLVILPCLALVLASGLIFGWVQPPAVYREFSGSYTYNFSQYQLSAQAILHGQAWLDLPVDPLLAQAAHPHSVAVRNSLLSQGATIYWDYAFYQGHWYSYFGIAPALLVFLPFQFFTSGIHAGGLWLNSIVASFLFIAVAIIFGFLAIIRFLKRYFPQVSLGITVLVLLMVLVGSTIISLITNLSFYCIPTASATFLTAAGFWLWLGAKRVYDPGTNRYKAWTRADCDQDKQQIVYFSYPRIALGSFCIGLTLGCRPPFILSALLLIPLYTELIKFNHQKNRTRSSAALHDLWGTLAALLPALAGMAPALISNKIKFGSFLNFGSIYQMTVEDLTTYKPALSSVVQGVLVNFWAPLQITRNHVFPFINSYRPHFVPWMYSDSIIAGIFVFAPLSYLALGFLLPPVRRKLKQNGTLGISLISLILCPAICALETYMGGVDWRYMNDFSWILTLSAIPVFVIIFQWGLEKARSTRKNWAALTLLWILILLVLVEILIFSLSIFDPARSHAVITVTPQVYYLFASIFQL